jgi:hypothetical protein
VDRLRDKILDDRLGGLGREKVDGENARRLYHAYVLTLDGRLLFLEDWLAGLPGLRVHTYKSTARYAIPLMIMFDKQEELSIPRTKLVEANKAAPPYRLFREISESEPEAD